jgi:hypothetical protein
MILDSSCSLEALFIVYGKNVSIEYKNNIPFVYRDSGFSKSLFLNGLSNFFGKMNLKINVHASL